jgi:hypothetical protein
VTGSQGGPFDFEILCEEWMGIAHGDDLDDPAGIAMQSFIDGEACEVAGGPG